MSLTAFAIEKDRITICAVALVLAAGVMAYRTMPRAEDPGFIVRTALVTTVFPGASPDRVESLVTDPIEKAVQEMPELDFTTSQSKTGVSIVHVNVLPAYSDMRPIWDDLRRKIEDVRGSLPEGIRGPFVNDSFGDVYGTIIAITGEGFDEAELEELADRARDELLLLPDAAKVEILGAQEERIFVEYSVARLAELGLTPLHLRSILESRNIVTPGGDVSTGHERIALEPTGSFESLDELRRTLISLPGQSNPSYLEDLAEVRRAYVDPPSALMRQDGRPCVGLAVSMREGGNILDLGAGVREALTRLERASPIGIDYHVVQFQADNVERKIDDFAGNLLQAVVIVTLVMLVSLGLRTGLVVASLIPSAIVMTLLVMSFAGIGLDQMSLASLIIALGMLVDNAIVMSESNLVKRAAGAGAFEAAVESAAELKIPLLTSSLTTAAAFLPIYLAESEVGEYTAPIFTVVTITLLCSWVLSITLIPLLCVRFLRVAPSAEGEGESSRLRRAYSGGLVLVLRRPLLSLAVVGLLLGASLWAFRFVPAIFFPPDDRATFTAELRRPAGTAIERTAEVVAGVERFVRDELSTTGEEQARVLSCTSFIGEGAPRFLLPVSPEPPSPEYAFLLLNASSRAAVDELIPRLQEFAFRADPDLELQAAPLQSGPPVKWPIEVRVSGRDRTRVFGIAEAVKQRVAVTPGVQSVIDDWGARSKKLVVEVDDDRARRAGVTHQDVAVSLQTVLRGFETTEFREGEDLIPIVMRSVAADRQDLGKLETLQVTAQLTGRSVPLSQVADLRLAWQDARVRRRGGLTTVTVQAALSPGVTAAEVNEQLRPWLEEQGAGWGLGYGWAFGGEAESSGEANAAIGAKLPIAGLIIVLLLVGQFNSFRRPLIILITIPLALIGVVAGLLLAGSYFGFMTLLGVISLAGIVINNAIVLLDRIQIEIEDNGLEPARAVVEAAQARLRPILLTTATTVGGLLPLYLGGGPMWEPMAITIMFGLVFATGLTLGVVPALYVLLFRVDTSSLRA